MKSSFYQIESHTRLFFLCFFISVFIQTTLFLHFVIQSSIQPVGKGQSCLLLEDLLPAPSQMAETAAAAATLMEVGSCAENKFTQDRQYPIPNKPLSED